MSFDPNLASTQVPPPPEPALISMSLADFAHATRTSPRPASMVLDVARHHAFTGEITFIIDPVVRVYLDAGAAYLAEVDGSPSVSQQLLSAQVIESPQLERGIVRVGDLEHLGRLFDRDESIDRDAVMVVVEHHTAQLVQLLCESVVSAVEISAYRHHPSGVHRWFVAQVDSTTSTRPLSGVTQIDRSVVDELPGLGRDGSDMRIEWTEPDPSGLGVPADRLVDVTSPTDSDLQAELDRFDADEADWAAGVAAGFVTPSDAPMSSPLGEFHIVWPNGTKDPDLVSNGLAPDEPSAAGPAPLSSPTTPLSSLTTPPSPAPPAVAPPVDEVAPPPLLPTPDTDAPPDDARPLLGEPSLSTPISPDVPAVAADASEPILLAPDESVDEPPLDSPPASTGVIAPLVLDEIPQPDAAIPEDVAAAVKRALAAIDEASLKPIALPYRTSISLPLLDVVTPQSLDTPGEQAPAASIESQRPPPPPPPAPIGFAPPTADMRAEAMYEHGDDDATTVDPVVVDPLADEPAVVEPIDDLAAEQQSSGQASVVFVDEEPTPAADRRGALRRLISGLRNNDD